MRIFWAADLYFAIVFTAGFILGTLRALFVAPRLGSRYAELLEMPFMLAASYFAAKFVVGRLGETHIEPLAIMGVGALVLMLAGEVLLIGPVRGLAIKAYYASRDRLTGTAYYLVLVLYAIMPIAVSRH